MTEPHVVTTLDDVRAAAERAPPGSRIPVEVRLTVDDPFDAYRRARRGPGGAFLETTGGQPGWGYFGVDPVERLTVSEPAESIETAAPSPTLAALEGVLATQSITRPPDEDDTRVPYPCGAIGWLSYDVARELETVPESAVDDRTLPRLELAVFDRLAAWEGPVDGPTTLRISACPRLDPESGDGVEAADSSASLFERGRDRALALATAILEGEPSTGPPPVDATDATFESECGRASFADRVRGVKQRIRAGETFQTNISQRLAAPAAVHPVAAYDAVRRVNPAPYSGLLEYRSADLVSASPELLLERDGDLVRTEPIAGTRPRGETEAEDEALAAELGDDEKERAEHAMLVDLERNDLGKVCEYGSVEVAEYRRIDRYAEVMHLVSDVRGRLREDATLADAIAATFPGGTITGAPKPRTMALIDEFEATRRGPYTGSMGIFGFDGRATVNIVIRTLVRQAETYHLRVGAGIVHDSVPEHEYDETLDKARALVTALDDALGDRAALAVETGATGADIDDATSDGGDRA